MARLLCVLQDENRPWEPGVVAREKGISTLIRITSYVQVTNCKSV